MGLRLSVQCEAVCAARFSVLVLLASHETGRKSPAKAGEPAGSDCLGKFQTG